jgi:DNA-binding winged helix-turn-helix (wHTH) protein
MTKRGSRDKIYRRDLLPVWETDRELGDNSIFLCRIRCPRKARLWFDERNKVGTDHVAPDETVPEPKPRDAVLEFGRFRLLPRRRQLIADGTPIELGSRAFDLLLALIEADGSLVTKDELLRSVWPGIFVTEENLKVQIFKLRKALGEDRDYIRTEFGRGYRFTAKLRSSVALGVSGSAACQQHEPSPWLIGREILRQPRHGWRIPRSSRQTV